MGYPAYSSKAISHSTNHLLNVLLQIANKLGLKKKNGSVTMLCSKYLCDRHFPERESVPRGLHSASQPLDKAKYGLKQLDLAPG
jgi:hypothetical protein